MHVPADAVGWREEAAVLRHLLGLHARLVPLVVHAGEDEHVQDEQRAPDGDGDGQGSGVGGKPVTERGMRAQSCAIATVRTGRGGLQHRRHVVLPRGCGLRRGLWRKDHPGRRNERARVRGMLVQLQ